MANVLDQFVHVGGVLQVLIEHRLNGAERTDGVLVLEQVLLLLRLMLAVDGRVVRRGATDDGRFGARRQSHDSLYAEFLPSSPAVKPLPRSMTQSQSPDGTVNHSIADRQSPREAYDPATTKRLPKCDTSSNSTFVVARNRFGPPPVCCRSRKIRLIDLLVSRFHYDKRHALPRLSGLVFSSRSASSSTTTTSSNANSLIKTVDVNVTEPEITRSLQQLGDLLLFCRLLKTKHNLEEDRPAE